MVLAVKTEGGGVLAENIRNRKEFVDEQEEGVCLSVFVVYRVCKGLAWQTLSPAAYHSHFGELGIKQRSPQHRESEMVTANLHVYLYSLYLSFPESESGQL